MTKAAKRVVKDGLTVTVEFFDREPATRVWDTDDEARTDAAVCAARFGSYVFTKDPVTPLVKWPAGTFSKGGE